MLAGMIVLSLSAAQTAAAPPAPETAAPAPSNQRLICRSRPRLGTRLLYQRVRKTAEEWTIYEHDLEQSRRDINDRGMRGNGGTIL